MSFPESNWIFYMITAVLAGVSGYFTRQLQKFEERNEQSNLKVLPSIYYLMLDFTQLSKKFIIDKYLLSYTSEVKKIHEELGKKILSGDLLPSKTYDDSIISFYVDLSIWKDTLVATSCISVRHDQDDRIENLVNSLKDETQQEGHKLWMRTNPKLLLDKAARISIIAESRIKKYRPISTLILALIIAIAIITGLANYIQSILNPE